MHLEQRQVLERRSVEDDLGPVLGEDLAIRARVADVGDDQVADRRAAPALERQLHRVQGRLVAVEHDAASAGAKWCSWRHSSQPIEPPAPVTSTRLP